MTDNTPNSAPTPTDLTGTTAFVTGGSSGLGRAMVEALAEAGARVAFTSRSLDRAHDVAQGIPGSLPFALDTRDADAVASVVEAAWAALDGIDLVVNNAGLGIRTVNPDFLTRPQGFWDVPVDGFRAVVDTNLTGYFLVAREAARRMLRREKGRIVTVSMNHTTMNRQGFVPYGPSRAGAEALARVMAKDLADTPVRSNILLPGGATQTGMLPEGTTLPKGMMLDPSIMARPIVWLASSAAAEVHDVRIVATEFEEWLASGAQ